MISRSYGTACDQGGSTQGNLTLDMAVAALRRRSRSDPATALPVQCQGLTAGGDDQYDDEAVSLTFDTAGITLQHDYTLDAAAPRQGRASNVIFDGLYNYRYDFLNP